MSNLKNNLLICLTIIYLFADLVFPQEPDTLWTKQFGGDSIDVTYDIEELWDGGFAAVGYTKSIPITNYDIWFLRLNSNGDTLWTRTYGGNGDEYGYSLKKTDDGGFILAGTTNSFRAGSFDFYVIRIDSIGDTLWTRTFGDVNNDYAWSVDNTLDGGFVIAGEFDADARIIKLDSSGTIIWDKSIGNTSDDERIRSIKSLATGYFITAGMSGCNGYASCNAWLVYLDQDGDTIWTKEFPQYYNSQLYSVSSTNNSYIIAVGMVMQTSGSYGDMFLIKLDFEGITVWSKEIDYDNDGDVGYSVQQTLDGGYIIAGQTHPFDGGSLSWVVRTDSFGNILWDKTFPYEFPNNPTEYEDGVLSAKQTLDGGYIVAGYQSGDYKLQVFLIRTASDIVPVELTNFTAKTNQNQVTLNWLTATETNNSGFEVQRSLIPNPLSNGEGTFQTIAFVPGFGTTTEPKSYSFTDNDLTLGKYQYRLKQIDFDGSFEYSQIVEAEITSPTVFSLAQNYPNPFNPTTKIKYEIPDQVRNDKTFVTLKVFDVLGNEVATLVNEQQQSGSYEVEFNAGQDISLSSGVYYYQLGAGSFVETKKMVLLR